MTKWCQRSWGLIRWSVWYWQQRRTWAPADADRAGLEDVAAAGEQRVLAALYEAGKRKLP